MEYRRFTKMVLGQILYGFSITLTLQANIGYCPWDVFHAGVANVLHISIGNAITLISVLLFLLSFPMKWRIGAGTIVNVLICGNSVDFFRRFVPQMHQFFPGLLMFVVGIVALAFASYLYIEPGYGTSVRDSFFVFLTKRLGGSVAFARILMEIGLILIGFLLGGKVGVGSVVSCLICGPCMQFVNKQLHFCLADVQHESITATIKRMASAVRHGK